MLSIGYPSLCSTTYVSPTPDNPYVYTYMGGQFGVKKFSQKFFQLVWIPSIFPILFLFSYVGLFFHKKMTL